MFKVGVVIKGIDGILEAIFGVALFFTSQTLIRDLVAKLVHRELLEDPDSSIARWLAHLFNHLPIGMQHFAAAYLLAHGLVKLGLVAGLLCGKLWAYPIALVVLSLFVCYQAYRFCHTHSIGLALLSAFDIIIIILIWQEYKNQKIRHGAATQPD
ncbi:MAG TPA: DUF2127 domain-containing protein [Verrucomicrobiae bacterium]|nr:DUF2127 domain-containing protein [Verrucomicrobiae bacterium]